MRDLLLSMIVLPKKFQLSAVAFSFLFALVLILFFNLSLWQNVFNLPYQLSLWNIGFFISLFVFLVAVTNILLLAMSVPYLQKPLTILIIMTAASASYFMDNYGIMIDKTMIQNTVETDISEALELLSVKLIIYVLFLGVLPALIIWQLTIKSQSITKAMISRLFSFSLSFLVIGIIAFLYYQDYASFFRNNRHLRHLVNPINFISATTSYTSKLLKLDNIKPQAIALDAKKISASALNNKPNLSILVVGETARAANFSLNGYDRNTNPQLSQRNIVNFTDVSSCGTATATSLPCMFSKFERDNYSHKKSKQFQGILDILTQVGISVLWRDNNSGCKGVCERVPTEIMSKTTHDKLCSSKECFDEILLDKLADFVDNLTQDTFIVLHQKGSHGPSYYQRYPKAFERFQPVCKTNQLQNCSQQEITNAYDNTILYTDHFLNKVIDFLTHYSTKYNTSMIYMSDHGESLGENGIYLHGTPYFIAPKEQTKIPFLLWFSEEYQQTNQVDLACLQAKQHGSISQDNLFHSILGINNIVTSEYKAELDIFNTCRNADASLIAAASTKRIIKDKPNDK